MPSGAAQKVAIERAVKAARAEQLAYNTQQTNAVQKLLRLIANAIKLELLSLQDGGRDVTPDRIPTLRAFLNGEADQLLQQYRGIVYQSLPESARIGAASVLPLTGSGLTVDGMVNQTMSWLTTFRAADGLQLSDRVWRVANSAKVDLTTAIENGIVRGQSSYQAALDFVNQGKPVPQALELGKQARQAAQLAAKAEELLANPKGNVMYAAQRVLRTEMNRAYVESNVASLAQHPDVIGIKYLLSPLHPKTDICDLYAGANLYGLGPGVYPPSELPYPAHPNTLCTIAAVFADEVTDADRAGKQTAFEWLGKQPAEMHAGVLGGKQKAEAFQAGQLDESELRAPWYQVAARMGVPA